MITSKVIKELYRKYRRPPKSVDSLDVPLLFDAVSETHGLEIKDDKLIVGSLDDGSPFRRLPLRRIHAIVNFEKDVAIVMHSSIIFLSKSNAEVRVNVKMSRPTLWQRIRMLFWRG